VGNLEEDAGPVAAVGVGAGCAPVAQVDERAHGELDDVVIALAGGRGHERDPASVVLEPRIAKIAAGLRQIGHSVNAIGG
jgi:hypothetical protein